MSENIQILSRERLGQLTRSGLPFHAVSGLEMTGANLGRLQRSMKAFGWSDPRFITEGEAREQGWEVVPESESVQIIVRDIQLGTIKTVTLFNAAAVTGIPSLEAMLAMSDSELSRMNGQSLTEQLDYVQSPDVPHEIQSIPNQEHEIPEERRSSPSIEKQDFSLEELEMRPAMLAKEREQDPALATHDSAQQRAQDDISAGTDAALSPAGASTVASLQPGYSRLIQHGAAPYDHVPENSGSYFAVLEDEKGERKTHWGVDIARSLAEAGVDAGDAIALTRGAKEKVQIKERAGDGSIVEKTVDRFKWHTERQPIVQEQTQESMQEPGELQEPTQARPPAADMADRSHAGIDALVSENGYAILAPYWADGLHNAEGVALAGQINKAIKEAKITKDREAIERMLAVHPRTQELGLQVVPYERYRDDPHLRANVAQPRSLINGALVRDKEGAYRPGAGGRPVIIDRGDAVLLKTKDADGYRAAMELAIAKGWTAIELKGKPAMLADAWLEAKLKGLDVVNYVPNEKDKARYAERLAQESARKKQVETQLTEQTPETVEVRPFIDADGHQKEAHITYTVETSNSATKVDANAKNGPSLRTANTSSLLRTVTRIDGLVRPDIMAGPNLAPRSAVASQVEDRLDHEFAEAVAEINEDERALASLSPATSGMHIGPIVAVKGHMIGQKTGRDPEQITWHDASKLHGHVPKLGEMAHIKYANGVGRVKEEPAQTHEMGGEGNGVGR